MNAATRYYAEVFNGREWVRITGACESKFIASLALTPYELGGAQVRIVEEN